MSDLIMKLLQGRAVEWKPLEEVFDIFAGGDLPKDALSTVETKEFNIPILSNGIGSNSLYGWTNIAKINQPSLTISARGTIGWTSFRDKPFFPIVRLLVLTPKIKLKLKFAYYFMKMIENNYKVSTSGIPQLTKPMIKNILIPIPPLSVQEEIVRILDRFTAYTAELTAELTMRQKQYNHYRDTLLTFQDGQAEWKTLGEVGEFIRGNGLQKADFTETGFPAIHYGQIYTKYGLFADKTFTFISNDLAKKLRIADKNDLLIATTSENDEDVLKCVGWLGEKIAISGDMILFRHNLNVKYLAYYFQTKVFQTQKQKYISGTKVKRISKENLAKFIIPIPPLSEQERIVAILDKFDTLTTSITEGLPREIELRQQQYEYYREQLLNFPKT